MKSSLKKKEDYNLIMSTASQQARRSTYKKKKKINKQKSIALLSASNEHLSKIKTAVPFIIVSKRIKDLEINLTKEV